MTDKENPKPDGRVKMPPEERRERFQRFCEAIEEGETLGEACKCAGIAWGSVQRWLADDRNTIEGPEGTPLTFASRYARARSDSGRGYADRGQREVEDANEDDWQVRKLRGEYYKWRASVADPKGYGAQPTNKVEVNVSLGSLHLDALRKVSASAKVMGDTNAPKSLPSQHIEDATVQPIEGE
jgi:hypothetical protein